MSSDAHLAAPRFGGQRPKDNSVPFRSRLAAWPAAVIMLVAAIFGGWMVGLGETSDEETRHVDHNYPPGSTMALEDLQVSLVELQSAQLVDGVEASEGVWVIVRLRLENHGKTAEGISNAELVDPAGYTFSSGSTTTPRVAPGFASTFDLGFIVDPERLPGLRLSLDNSGIYTFADERASLDLGIDPNRAGQLADAAVGRSVELRDEELEGM